MYWLKMKKNGGCFSATVRISSKKELQIFGPWLNLNLDRLWMKPLQDALDSL